MTMAETAQRQDCKLPAELIEKILRALVDGSDHDPALQWTRFRHLSSHQMRSIERHFRAFWLPKLVVTLYHGPWQQIDYKLVKVEKRSDAESDSDSDSDALDIAHFQVASDIDPRRLTPEVLATLWKEYSFENRIAHVRLGEGFLNNGFKGAYIINDTGLPELRVGESGSDIRFNWRGAFNELLREELLLRKVHGDILAAQIENSKLENSWPTSETIPRNVHLKLLVLNVQMSRRVAVLKYRARRHDPSGQTQIKFHITSQHLHGEPVTHIETESTGRCCWACSRKTAPDIFEVIAQEESMVPMHPEWNLRDDAILLDLYAEEFGWGCCRCQGRIEDVKFQQARKEGWKANVKNARERLTGIDRWDLLG